MADKQKKYPDPVARIDGYDVLILSPKEFDAKIADKSMVYNESFLRKPSLMEKIVPTPLELAGLANRGLLKLSGDDKKNAAIMDKYERLNPETYQKKIIFATRENDKAPYVPEFTFKAEPQENGSLKILHMDYQKGFAHAADYVHGPLLHVENGTPTVEGLENLLASGKKIAAEKQKIQNDSVIQAREEALRLPYADVEEHGSPQTARGTQPPITPNKFR